jgi:alpha-glucosidase
MQWDASRFAGFSTSEPWLPITEDFSARNVDAQRRDPRSLYSLYRELLTLRRKHPALATGGYQPVAAQGDVLAYMREQHGERFFVALNFGGADASVAMPEGKGTVVLSLLGGRSGEPAQGRLELAGSDGMLVKLD